MPRVVSLSGNAVPCALHRMPTYPRDPPPLWVSMLGIVQPVPTEIVCEHARWHGLRWYWRAIGREATEHSAGCIVEWGGTKVINRIRRVVDGGIHVVHSDGGAMQCPEAAVKKAGGSSDFGVPGKIASPGECNDESGGGTRVSLTAHKTMA
jgi:hypothetical protein